MKLLFEKHSHTQMKLFLVFSTRKNLVKKGPVKNRLFLGKLIPHDLDIFFKKYFLWVEIIYA